MVIHEGGLVLADEPEHQGGEDQRAEEHGGQRGLSAEDYAGDRSPGALCLKTKTAKANTQYSIFNDQDSGKAFCHFIKTGAKRFRT